MPLLCGAEDDSAPKWFHKLSFCVPFALRQGLGEADKLDNECRYYVYPMNLQHNEKRSLLPSGMTV